MKVVLLRDVAKLGKSGETKVVADGYGKNFLLPRGLAVSASEGTVKIAALQKQINAAREDRTQSEIEELAKQIEGKQVELTAKVGAKDRIYGSITSADIAKALKKLTGLDIDKKRIELEKPIHEVGAFSATIKLSAEFAPRVTVVVKGE